MIVRLLKIFGIILLSASVLLLVLFYRQDRSFESLESTYFTTNSHYQDIEILALDETPLNLRIHYQDFGSQDDPVVVLLHGAFASSHTFEPWAMILNDAGYRVIAIDLPYHGLSDGFEDQVTSQRRSAAVVYALIESLDISTFFIGGNSMGGGVSWYFTSVYHTLDSITVQGLILIDAVPPRTESGGSFTQSSFLRRPVVSRIASKMTPKFLLNYILKGVYGSSSVVTDETLTRYYELILKEGFRQGLLTNMQEDASSETMTQTERLSLIKDLEIPILVMWGAEDTWISVETVDIFRDLLELSDDDIVIYPGIGHVPMEENPILTSVELIAFLNRNT